MRVLILILLMLAVMYGVVFTVCHFWQKAEDKAWAEANPEKAAKEIAYEASLAREKEEMKNYDYTPYDDYSPAQGVWMLIFIILAFILGCMRHPIAWVLAFLFAAIAFVIAS